MLRDARVLVTGGSGFLGSAVVRELLAAGAQVHLLARRTADLSRLQGLRERLPRHDGDLRAASTVRRAVRQAAPDFVFHLAAAGVTDPFLPPETALRHNVSGMLNLLRAVNGRARLVAARTPGEDEAASAYAASKAAGWQFARMYARAAGWPVQGVMPFQCYGPGQPGTQVLPSAVRAALAGEDFPMTHGNQVRDWVAVRDAGRGFRAAAERGPFNGTTLGLGTGVGTRLLVVVEKIYRLAGRGGRPLPGALPPRPGEVPAQVADAGATERATGWRAEVSLEEGLRQLLQDADGRA